MDESLDLREEKIIYTYGWVSSADGAAVEPLAGGWLIHWDGKQLKSGMKHTFEDIHPKITPEEDVRVVYKAAPLAKWQGAIRFPHRVCEYESLEELVNRLQTLLAYFVDSDTSAALLLAVAVLGTWVAECLPGPLIINLVGPSGSETPLLNVMKCLCRRVLQVVELSLGNLASLPLGLRPTVVVDRPSPSQLSRIVQASKPGSYLLRKPLPVRPDHKPVPAWQAKKPAPVRIVEALEPVQLGHAFIVCSDRPLPLDIAAITIQLGSTPIRTRLSELNLYKMANLYQPQLLRFRLTQHQSVANAKYDDPKDLGLGPAACRVAQTLGVTVESSESLRASLIAALGAMDEQQKAERSLSPAAVVSEALLRFCHENQPIAYVGKVADVANELLKGRNETLKLSPPQVGGIIRTLQIPSRRVSAGWKVTLDEPNQKLIHRLGSNHYIFPLAEPSADCALCKEVAAPAGEPDTPEAA